MKQLEARIEELKEEKHTTAKDNRTGKCRNLLQQSLWLLMVLFLMAASTSIGAIIGVSVATHQCHLVYQTSFIAAKCDDGLIRCVLEKTLTSAIQQPVMDLALLENAF